MVLDKKDIEKEVKLGDTQKSFDDIIEMLKGIKEISGDISGILNGVRIKERDGNIDRVILAMRKLESSLINKTDEELEIIEKQILDISKKINIVIKDDRIIN